MRRMSTGSASIRPAAGLTTGLAYACGLLLMSTGIAQADCAADFTEINHVKPGAGSYEVESRMSITLPAISGKTSPPAESNIVTQVVPPKSFRVQTRSAEVVIVSEGEASRGWVKTGDIWNDVPKEKLPDLLADAPTGSYFITKGMANLRCEGTTTVEGKSYLTFIYDSVTNPGAQTPQSLQVTAYFDPATRRPAAGQIDGAVVGARIRSTMTYRFDPSIRIEPPDR
jgi:hypothetical protein